MRIYHFIAIVFFGAGMNCQVFASDIPGTKAAEEHIPGITTELDGGIKPLEKSKTALDTSIDFISGDEESVIAKISEMTVNEKKDAREIAHAARDMAHFLGLTEFMNNMYEQEKTLMDQVISSQKDIVGLEEERKEHNESIKTSAEEIQDTTQSLKDLYEKEYLTKLDSATMNALAPGSNDEMQALLDALRPNAAPDHSSQFLETAMKVMEDSSEEGLELTDALQIQAELHNQFEELAKAREKYLAKYKEEIIRSGEGLKAAEEKLAGGGLTLKEELQLRTLVRLNNANFENYEALTKLVEADIRALNQADNFIRRNFLVTAKRSAWGEKAGEHFLELNHGQMPTLTQIESTPVSENAFDPEGGV